MSETEIEDAVAAAQAALSEDRLDVVQGAYLTLVRHVSRDGRVPPLAAAMFDRMRILTGQPQKFGTQTRDVDGRRELWPVDPGTTDSERSKWGVLPLAELHQRVEDGEDPLR